MCMTDSKMVQIFSEVILLLHPPKHNGVIQYMNCRKTYGREVTFLLILGWNVILLDQTKVKRQQECQDGAKSLT